MGFYVMVESRAYQNNFSAMFCKAVYNREARQRKAKTIIAVLSDFFGTDFRSFAILDVGLLNRDNGELFFRLFWRGVGIDIDKLNIRFLHKSKLDIARITAKIPVQRLGEFEMECETSSWRQSMTTKTTCKSFQHLITSISAVSNNFCHPLKVRTSSRIST